jgi:multidrug efflux pump subunit AcrA (membrane-fusion protein)
MKTKLKKLLILSIILASLLTACGGEETATPEAADEYLTDFVPLVSATGKVIPKDRAVLSMPVPGVVVDIFVEDNDRVEEGQTLLQLSGTSQGAAAVSAAQLELVSAEQALEELFDSAAITAAEMQQALANARDALRDAERDLVNAKNPSDQPDIDAAYANLILARDQLEDAQEEYDKHRNKPEGNVVRATFLSLLSQAQNNYDDAVRVYNNRISASNEIDVAQAEADLAHAQALLEKITEDYNAVKDGIPDPDDLALAQARLDNAQKQLAAAQTALDDLTLTAPFEGTINLVYVHVNEWISLGQPVIAIGSPEELQVETTDLNEIDVARIQVGSQATVTFDALPDVSVGATVASIASKSSPGTGVNYTVVLELDEIPEGLLWDMTAFVDIEVE